MYDKQVSNAIHAMGIKRFRSKASDNNFFHTVNVPRCM
jgi:hypothetical protein